jgi:Cu(I)/Ag(I) efflux system membrane fusion protein
VTFTGKVSFISPVLDPQTRTVRIRAEVDNRLGLLKPNMYVEALIDGGRAPLRLVVPSTAVLDTGVRRIVYVDQGNGRFVGHRVLTGSSSDGWTSILAGLELGDLVAVSGAFLIDSQAQLTGAREIDYTLPAGRL